MATDKMAIDKMATVSTSEAPTTPPLPKTSTSTPILPDNLNSNNTNLLLRRANDEITKLKEEIRRLSHDLKQKDSSLASYRDIALEQSRKISTLTSTLQDTAPWDPSTCPRPSSSSTPCPQPSWSEVAVRVRATPHRGSPRPSLDLSNRFAPLSSASPDRHTIPSAKHLPDPSTTLSQHPPSPAADVQRRHLLSPPSDDSRRPPNSPSAPSGARCPDGKQSPSRKASASVRRRILREAVLRHTHGLPSYGPSELPPSSSSSTSAPVVTAPPPHQPARRHNSNGQLLASSPRPLFPPSTLIIGDSIIRNVRFFNATTHCLPGASASDILAMLPGLLPTLPPSITRVIVHIGTCDTSLHRSELTKKSHPWKRLWPLQQNP